MGAFADALKPVCSPAKPELCDDEQVAQLDKYKAMGVDALKSLIADGKKSMENAEETFKNEVSRLQAKYQELVQNKEDTITKIKSSGLGLAKSVMASMN